MQPLDWLVIGIGDITTKRVIPAIQAEPRSRLAGIVTRHPAKAERYSVPAWDSLEEALAGSKAGAVYVASPVFLHAPQTITALRAGSHVLCEKPVGMNYAEACAMARAAEETSRILGIAYYRRMYRKVQRARDLLAQGVIGQPVLAEINCQSWFQDEDGARSWLLDPGKAGGGPLYDIASHRIDILNFFFGRPMRVCGQISNVVHKSAVEDSATLLIEYEQGVRGVVDVRWHCRVARDEFRIIGADGEMSLSPLSSPILRYPGGEEDIPTHANLHYPCVENFVEAVLDGKHLYASGATSVWTDWVTEQVMNSR